MADNLKELVSYQQLQSARRWIWGWIFFLCLFLLAWQWPALTMVPLQHTFLLSVPSPGSLQSEWWSLDHFIGLFVLCLWIVPLTLAFASDSPLASWRRMMHMVLTFLLFLITLLILVWWAIQYEAANDPTASNANNPANDPRWCCVNFALAPQRCAPVSPLNLCNPSPGQVDLVVAPMFLYRFWFLVVFMLLLILDFFVIVKGIFERAISQYRREVFSSSSSSMTEEDDEESAPAGYRGGGPLPSAPPSIVVVEDPPLYNAKGQPYCARVPPAAQQQISMKDQLRAAAARQQHLKGAAAAAATGNKYFGKNSKR